MAALLEATIAALETLADENDVRREAGRLYRLATHHPPIGDRLEAVRNGGGDGHGNGHRRRRATDRTDPDQPAADAVDGGRLTSCQSNFFIQRVV